MGIGASILGGMYKAANDQRMHQESLDQNREIADETLHDLDRMHAENLKELRNQGILNRAVLTKGMGDIKDAIEYEANHMRYNTIDVMAVQIKNVVDDPYSDHVTTVRFLSDLFNKDEGQLSFIDAVSVTSWWLMRNFPESDKLEQQLAITKTLFGYWTCKLNLIFCFTRMTLR